MIIHSGILRKLRMYAKTSIIIENDLNLKKFSLLRDIQF
jgi:hypothetical protein